MCKDEYSTRLDNDTTIKKAELDMVNHPPHYKKKGRCLETIDCIQKFLTEEEYIGYLKGNILKYTDRYKEKGLEQDLDKASWYLAELKRFEYGD